MGMAASQARFLGLTARKTNTEYEGQQVNQQRTALANESSGLFNRMLELQVPTPPDSYNYYKDTYKFDYDGDNYTIVNISNTTTDNVYNINTKYNQTTAMATYKQISQLYLDSLPANANNGSISIGGSTYDLYASKKNPTMVQNWNDNHEKQEWLDENTMFYSYVNSEGVTNYISEDQLNNKEGETINNVSDYYNVNQSVTKYKQFENVSMYKDEDGNYYNVVITDEDGKKTNCTTTSTREMDDQAYARAMTQYTTAKNQYDKEISDINAKTENIQQQDKTLELRLKQLDTEQSALQTELEAVSKVIEKNVESTFKTFA
ncbi:MAG: hypothetical protein PHV37_02300 [Candidatus Gastranaerophilales bacterium]|nr:hypothetical protein [Candidatus Gastranaerophilales bacterium]